jgi:hypothetical protein
MLDPLIHEIRRGTCQDCRKRRPECAALDLGDACAACPLGAWGAQGECGGGAAKAAAPAPLGDRVAAKIEEHVLGPARAYAPEVVSAVARCGGCHQSRQRLGSKEPHRDPGVVL